MITPSKHEKLDTNLLVIGSVLLKFLKKKDSWNLELLFQKVQKEIGINLDQYYNCLTFLWLTGIIDLDQFFVFKLDKKDAVN